VLYTIGLFALAVGSSITARRLWVGDVRTVRLATRASPVRSDVGELFWNTGWRSLVVITAWFWTLALTCLALVVLPADVAQTAAAFVFLPILALGVLAVLTIGIAGRPRRLVPPPLRAALIESAKQRNG
jgi:hypothetical protein